MTAGGWILTDECLALLAGKGTGLQLRTDPLAMVLLDDGHVPDVAHATWADASADECAGAGYTPGGIALASPAVTAPASGTSRVDYALVTFEGVTVVAKYAAIVQGTPVVSGTDPFLAYAQLKTEAPGYLSTGAGDIEVDIVGFLDLVRT